MIDKKKLHESLGNFIDAVTNGDENDQDIFRGFVDGKVEDVLNDGSHVIKLEGNDVMIDGKKVGKTTPCSDDDDEGKIKFESDCGKHNKEFDSVEGMYEFLNANYGVAEGAKQLQVAALSVQSEKKGERLKRWSAVRNTKQSDGKEGEYDAKDLRPEHKDPIKGGSEAAHSGGEADLKTSMKYDAHDPRSKHKDPQKG
jgi:hypothetical protein